MLQPVGLIYHCVNVIVMSMTSNLCIIIVLEFDQSSNTVFNSSFIFKEQNVSIDLI